MILKSLRLENFKGVTDKTYDFGSVTRVKGENRLGKTTIGTALFWLFSDGTMSLKAIRISDRMMAESVFRQ